MTPKNNIRKKIADKNRTGIQHESKAEKNKFMENMKKLTGINAISPMIKAIAYEPEKIFKESANEVCQKYILRRYKMGKKEK